MTDAPLRRYSLALALLAALAVPAVPAAADHGPGDLEASVTALRPGFGLRIGGYGFREVYSGETSWTECRMDGFGAFGTLDIGPILFTELGLDVYQSTGQSFDESGMDRTDISLLGAFGVRPFPGSVIRPFAQLGLGAAIVDVSMEPTGESFSDLVPMGFVGTGAELAIGDNLRLGANLRLFLLASLGHPDAFAAKQYTPVYVTMPELEPGMAGQVQFWGRWDF